MEKFHSIDLHRCFAEGFAGLPEPNRQKARPIYLNWFYG